MLTVLAIIGASIITVLGCLLILVIIEAKNGGELPYDWWDDEEKSTE